MTADRKLTRDAKGEEEQSWPWDEGVQKRFKFDVEDIARLEDGGIVWRGDTAFSLEDED